MPTAVRSAVVVGGGVGGLAVAGGLSRTGWQVVLLEAADRLRAGPAALLLWAGGVRALRALDLGGGLAAIATEVPVRGIGSPDGRRVVPPPDVAVEPPLLVHAEDLHDALVAGLGDYVDVRTGVRVGPAGAPRPSVTDGRHTWEADLVVAADGAGSAMRAAVAPGVAVVSAGATTWQAVIPWYRATAGAPAGRAGAAAPVLLEGGGFRFRSAPLGERGSSGRGGVFWSVTGPGAPRPEPAATQLGLLRRWLAYWPSPVPELLAATEPGDLVQRELRTLRPPPARLVRRVGPGALVLLGDAGHALADHLGLGACLAVEDAATLVSAAREAWPGRALHGAVDAYDRQRRGRVARVRRRSDLLAGTGRVARLPGVRARRLARALHAAAGWEPPEG
jgi:2-polyprenyl-6-methoxyphenol hydroxylase-like FAD-dependent oxidoreductase